MKNLILEDGIELINSTLKQISKKEIIKIENSLNKISFEDIKAKYDNPPFNRSAIDGYACKISDIDELPKNLKIVYEICAGDDTYITTKNCECVRIMTGAEIPENLDCCIRQEDVEIFEDHIKITKKIKKFDNYCFKGEDYKKGDVLIKKGTLITFAEIGLLASMGYEDIKVFKEPSIAIISTGDEVVMPTEILPKSKIFNSNLFLIEARLKELGFTNIQKLHIKDDFEKIAEKISSIYKKTDLVITTGGVSVGMKDIFHEVVEEKDFKQIFWKLQIQPGTPIMYSLYKDMPVISLSGNPFAALVNFELVVRPLIFNLYPSEKLITKKFIGILKNEFNKKSKKRRFVRATYSNGNVFLNDLHSSGSISSLSGCNCLIEIKENSEELKINDLVNIILIN